MARNKHPERTVNKILDTAYRLFTEKGYEQTSIQDIIDNLGGLSKGAIYHHFKSKAEILVAVSARMTEQSNRMLEKIADRPGLSGKEKLKAIFWESIIRPEQDDIFSAAPHYFDDPKLLFSMLHETVEYTAPKYVLPILRQGIEDGSIQTDCPEQLAELILLVTNLWMNPMVFDDSVEDLCRKYRVFSQMLSGFGLDIMDDKMFDRFRDLVVIYNENK